MGKYEKCGVCHEWCFDMPEHRCQPRWNVWEEGEADADNTEEFRYIHARTAEEAAEKCAHEMNDDGPQRRRLYVRRPGAATPAQLYQLDYEITVEYSVKPITPKK